LFIFIPIGIIFILLGIFQSLKEHHIFVEKEIGKFRSEQDKNHTDYKAQVEAVLLASGIDSKRQFETLKEECAARVRQHRDSISKVDDNMFKAFVWVPLGFLIASVFDYSKTVSQAHIILLLFVSPIVFMCIRAVKGIYSLMHEHKKDVYLLDVINELDYGSTLWAD